MSRKATIDVFQTKTTRNDRFAQMSHQEKIIEQKKKEIQAKLDQKLKNTSATSESKSTSGTTSKKSSPKPEVKKYNQFSNDGSFLDQFKQLKDKKIEQKLKSFRNSHDRNHSDDRNKNSRWSHRKRTPSPKPKNKISRFSDKLPFSEPKINISTSYSNLISQANFNVQPPQQVQVSLAPQNIMGQPLMKNDIFSLGLNYPTNSQTNESVIAAAPVMLNVPPPQVVQQQTILTQTNSLLNHVSSEPPTVITTLNIPPPSTVTLQNASTVSLVPSLELTSIPPPNPIQVQNIPPPEPINALNIPPPAPIQVQNIPPPSPIQLNEIPNPKPIDVVNIPTPGDASIDKAISDPNFLKNVPPPNKSIPPPSLQDTISVNVAVPPPNPIKLPPTSLPPPTQTISVQNLLTSQNIVVHSVPPPQVLPPQTMQSLSTVLIPQVQTNPVQNLNAPPPQTNLASTVTISVAVPVQNPGNISNTNAIPSLLAQPVLPPPGMNLNNMGNALPVNIHCPPPMVLPSPGTLQTLPPSFVTPPPSMPPMNVPPPTTANLGVPYRDITSGTPEYEAMASLGRMVAQCGSGIEDIICQRKPQDPNLWFLFRKESTAYQQYRQLVERFKSEMVKVEVKKEDNYQPEDLYEPEMAIEDDCDRPCFSKGVENHDQFFVKSEQRSFDEEASRRKRRSRWGEKDISVPPPTVMMTNNPPFAFTPNMPASSNISLSKITRNDPGLLQYVMNTYGTSNLNEEDWKKAEENYKINLVYQDMLKKRQEMERRNKSGKNKYDYDSDEEIDGGTWEHKLREKEMTTTQIWATELTRNAEGKHHIGDFLPPEELQKFLDKSINPNVKNEFLENSDYEDFKLKEDNVGFKMLQKLGWSEGQGLGASASGILEPVNKASQRDQNQGLGLDNPSNLGSGDDEYDAYRKRMMLAYRFRPNPLNNPRRPYY